LKTTDEVAEMLFYIDDVLVQYKDENFMLFTIADLGVLLSTVGGWDHLAVSVRGRTPTYQEMKAVKRLCFLDSEWAYEVHPAVDDYVSIHHNALHIWRPHDGVWRAPPIDVFMNPWGDNDKNGHINPLDSLSPSIPEA
jgi:hypothetical protein